jgi:peroxiredoxin
MKRVFSLLPAAILALSLTSFGQLVAPGSSDAPKVGDMAPDFSLPKSLGSKDTLGLKDFAGKKKVLLTFFPAAFTGG